MGIFEPFTKAQICAYIAFQTLCGSLVYILLARPLITTVMSEIHTYSSEDLTMELNYALNAGYEEKDHIPQDQLVLVARMIHTLSPYAVPLIDGMIIQWAVLAQLFTWWYMSVFAPKLLSVYKFCFEIIRDAVVIFLRLPGSLIKDVLEVIDPLAGDEPIELKSE